MSCWRPRQPVGRRALGYPHGKARAAWGLPDRPMEACLRPDGVLPERQPAKMAAGACHLRLRLGLRAGV